MIGGIRDPDAVLRILRDAMENGFDSCLCDGPPAMSALAGGLHSRHKLIGTI